MNDDIDETRGDLTGAGRRFGIVASRFNERIGGALIAGAVDCLRRHGVAAADILLVSVPGAWEIPQALHALALSAQNPRNTENTHNTQKAQSAGNAQGGDSGAAGRRSRAGAGGLDGLIALGVVIRGETPHFDYLARECTAGIARAGERHGLPVAYGVLTCDTTRQAEERAGGKAGNKGWEAALAALEMANLFACLRT
jgi:6,7-dimethyl-8-ribityllumazine synthase